MARVLDETPLAKVGEIVTGTSVNDEDQSITYKVEKPLGKGSFGAVFLVKRIGTDMELAMKCEPVVCRRSMFPMECKVLANAKLSRSPHFIVVQDKGKVEDRYNFLIMQLVWKNLWDLRAEREGYKFSMNTSLRAGEQCLSGIRDLHEIGFLHRDIKPPNFAVGRTEEQKQQTVFILDFGLSRKYKNHEGNLCPERAVAPFRGTSRYASCDAIKGHDQSRKDDVEAWFYMMLEWTLGDLPWKAITDRQKILEAKKEFRTDENWQETIPNGPLRDLRRVMKYLDELIFESIPDYDGIYHILRDIAFQFNLNPNDPLDWATNHDRYTGPPFRANLDDPSVAAFNQQDHKREGQLKLETKKEEKKDPTKTPSSNEIPHSPNPAIKAGKNKNSSSSRSGKQMQEPKESKHRKTNKSTQEVRRVRTRDSVSMDPEAKTGGGTKRESKAPKRIKSGSAAPRKRSSVESKPSR